MKGEGRGGPKELRHGYTTGACAAAAAKGAALMLRDRRFPDEVELILPAGITVRFRLHGQRLDDAAASCYVVKDAGDDPDITNGAEVHARVSLTPIRSQGEKETALVIEGGTGIGRVTKPGLAVPVGEWAINPVPRRMIGAAIREVFPDYGSSFAIHCILSIPNGAELAQKTLNARLGIIGGLSILGTTGIVRPISAKAWTDTIDAAIDVALACGCEMVVLSTGRTSELVAQNFVGAGKGLKEEAFVMMGDHVGYAVGACGRKGVKRVVIAGQFAKLLKIACGHAQTHVLSSDLDLRILAEWRELKTRNPELKTTARQANTARELLEASGHDRLLLEVVCGKAREFVQRLAPEVEIKVLLAGYGGEVLYFG